MGFHGKEVVALVVVMGGALLLLSKMRGNAGGTGAIGRVVGSRRRVIPVGVRPTVGYFPMGAIVGHPERWGATEY